MRTAIGLMSGTSMDGIDVALVESDGKTLVRRGAFLGIPYEASFRARLKTALEEAKHLRKRDERPGHLHAIERELTMRHVDAVRKFLAVNNVDAADIDVIGFHGQTVLHKPDEALTVQLGDGNLLATETGIPVVFDMRANDMAHGGQGAPLVPVYHAALAKNAKNISFPVCFVNIGGISNLTYVDADGAIIAFDSGPGNNLIDQWIESHTGHSYDKDGAIASQGDINLQIAGLYLENPFFTAKIRRSLDRGDFGLPDNKLLSVADGARTLTYVAAAAVMKSATHFPVSPRSYIVCGGGRLNRVLMQDLIGLADQQNAQVLTAEEAGFDGDAMEAEAWAYLAIRSLEGLPLTFPSTTGVQKPVSGGVTAHP